MNICDFEIRLDQEEFFQCLQLACEYEAQSLATAFIWFIEICRGRNSLLDENYVGRHWSTIKPENVLTI